MEGDVGGHGIEQRNEQTEEQVTGGRADRQGNGDSNRMPQHHGWEMLGWRQDSHYCFSCLCGPGGQSGQSVGVGQSGSVSW